MGYLVLGSIKSLLFVSLLASTAFSQASIIKEAREKLNEGDVKGAIGFLERNSKKFPESADIHYWLGMAYFKNNEVTNALNSVLTALSIKPKHLLARSLLLDIHLKTETFAEAKNQLEFLLNESPNDLNLLIKKAECLIGLNQFEAASIELARLEVQKDLPQSTRTKIYLLLGDVYSRQSINATAITYYTKAISLNSALAETHLKLGKIYFRERQYNDALKAYLEAVKLDSNSREANLNVGYIYFNGGKTNPQQYGNAIYYLQKYSVLEPSDHIGFLLTGRSYHALRSYKNAIAALEKSAALDTSASRNEAFNLLAECYSATSDHARAIATYEMLNKAGFNLQAKDFVRLGFSYKALGDTINTGKYFDRAASLDSSYHMLYLDMGSSYYGSKNYPEAIRWFEKRIAVNPNDSNVASAWQNLGLSQFYVARTRQDTLTALSSIRKALSLKPYSQAYWLVYAQVAERTDSVESATAAYQKAADMDTNNVQAYFGLASISFRLKRNDDAIDYFMKVIRKDNKNKYAPYYLSQCYLRQKKHAAAIPYLKKYLELDPGGPFAADSKRILSQLGAN